MLFRRCLLKFFPVNIHSNFIKHLIVNIVDLALRFTQMERLFLCILITIL